MTTTSAANNNDEANSSDDSSQFALDEEVLALDHLVPEQLLQRLADRVLCTICSPFTQHTEHTVAVVICRVDVPIADLHRVDDSGHQLTLRRLCVHESNSGQVDVLLNGQAELTFQVPRPIMGSLGFTAPGAFASAIDGI